MLLFRRGKPALRTLAVTLAVLLPTFILRAHGPFDGSVRMLVREDSIEATVTLGTDAARAVLANAGLSTNNTAELIRPRGPHSIVKLPPAVAAHFLVIHNGAETLPATNGMILSDGLEVIITLIYPRVERGTLDVRAVFYEEVAGMRSGSFFAHDENGTQLGAAQLSRAAVTAQVALPSPMTRSHLETRSRGEEPEAHREARLSK
jgi:hypothetical protein